MGQLAIAVGEVDDVTALQVLALSEVGEPVRHAAHGAAGREHDPLATIGDVAASEETADGGAPARQQATTRAVPPRQASHRHPLPGSQHEQGVLGDAPDGVVEPVLAEELPVRPAVDGERRPLEQGEVPGVVVAVVGEGIAGAEGDVGGVGPPVRADEDLIEGVRTEEGRPRQDAVQGLQAVPPQALEAGVVEEPEPPQVVAVVAPPPENLAQVVGVGRQRWVARRLGQEIDDRAGFLDQVYPRPFVAEALRPLVRTHRIDVPATDPAQKRPYRLGVSLTLQAVQVGGRGQRQDAPAGIDPIKVPFGPPLGQGQRPQHLQEVALCPRHHRVSRRVPVAHPPPHRFPRGVSPQIPPGVPRRLTRLQHHGRQPCRGGERRATVPQGHLVIVEQDQGMTQGSRDLAFHNRPVLDTPPAVGAGQVVGDRQLVAVPHVPVGLAGDRQVGLAQLPDQLLCPRGLPCRHPAGGQREQPFGLARGRRLDTEAAVGLHTLGQERGHAAPVPRGETGQQDPRVRRADPAVERVACGAGGRREQAHHAGMVHPGLLRQSHQDLRGTHVVVALQPDEHGGQADQRQAAEHERAHGRRQGPVAERRQTGPVAPSQPREGPPYPPR